MSSSEILAAALELPEAERERLAIDIWNTLSSDRGVAEAWAHEIERRVLAIERGEVASVGQEDARSRIQERLAVGRR
ncbi:MAG: addiction module protein [Alphaproteobacteria bacterium]|nr:addiction module protein [Alphaproteobacteria bacterium]MCB9692426.1 addiction module protein [Alphaproteobacteria bacterium]